MWHPKTKYPEFYSSTFSNRSTAFIDREFQLKYTKYLILMAGVSSCLFLFPMFYFANQNYRIFLDLADTFNPALSDYLLREYWTLNIFFGFSVFANFVFWWVFGHKMTEKIVGPAKILRNHIRLVSRGDLAVPPLRIRQTDEFRDLVQAYNYMLTVMKVQNEKEWNDLKRVRQTMTNPMAAKIIDQILDEKAMRLNLPIDPMSPLASEFAANAARPRDPRHAS